MSSSPTAELSVLVADSHRLLADAVARLLSTMDEVGATASASSSTATLEAARRVRPDVVLVDDRLGGRSALDLVAQLTASEGPPPAVLMFACSGEPLGVVEALRVGASGWVLKDCRFAALRCALVAVSTGRRWVAQEVQSEVIGLLLHGKDREPGASPLASLSARQREVLGCLSGGLTHAATASLLQVSPNTVRTHVRTMCQVLDVHSTPALVALARRWGLSPDQPSPADRTGNLFRV